MIKSNNFGYTKVTNTQKTKLVQKVFSDVASNYDLMNDIMSLGAHRLWKKRFIELINPLKHECIVDVGSGSGDIAKEILKTNFIGKLHLVDLNKKMLDLGKKNIKNENVFFHLENAENLKFKNNSFDKYLISFCLRNISNIDKSINEAYRILKPGGQYFCLEFSNPESIFISKIYKQYKSFLPFIGKIIANDKKSYNYLSESIDLFPNKENLKKKLVNMGFSNVTFINMFDGIVTIHKAYKI